MIDYFELFDLKVSFTLDEGALKKKFYKLSRDFHPDHFTMENAEKQEEVLQMSSVVNTAYKVLQDDKARMKYILEKYDLLKGIDNESLPQDFLMQMMDINETIFDLQMSPDPIALLKVKTELASMEDELREEADKWIHDFENQIDTDKALENIKYYYLKSKYLLRIRENLSTFARS
ncbi:MAG: Fe-S protein assembly co-chaperone HscB [Saprospiraceae bacterium]|nr:Fe-S protein assembly co-chaperone HscB [Saprospiraceae bacterium]